MTINPGMLIFCLLDSAIAFLLVFFVSRAKFGGEKSMLARVISAILGTLVFIVHFGVLIWFNTEPVTISAAGKAVVYAAPIVLSILMIILTLLSQPPKKENEEETEESENDTEETATAETFYIYFFKCFFLIFEMLQANIIATTFFLLFK